MVYEQLKKDRIIEFDMEPLQVISNWEFLYQLRMHELLLPFDDIRKLPCIFYLKKFKSVSYSYLKTLLLNVVENYFLQISSFNYHDEFEMSAKLKKLSERTLIEYMKALIIYQEKIRLDIKDTKNIEVDLLAAYFTKEQYILFDVNYSKTLKAAQDKNLYAFYCDVVEELNNWYDKLEQSENIDHKKEAINV